MSLILLASLVSAPPYTVENKVEARFIVVENRVGDLEKRVTALEGTKAVQAPLPVAIFGHQTTYAAPNQWQPVGNLAACPKGICLPHCNCVNQAECGTANGCPLVRPAPYLLPPPVTSPLPVATYISGPAVSGTCSGGNCAAPASSTWQPFGGRFRR